MTLHIALVEADRYDGWTQIFGRMASEPEKSGLVEKCLFCLSCLHGMILLEFHGDLWH